MELFYPEYYQKFKCIAGACPDSCCKQWAVDVDADAAFYYRSLPGPLGDRLRQVLEDTPEGTVMTITDGRCPMWETDGLCRIQRELGEEALCQVCSTYPRLEHDYGAFREYGLELSCPEAARLILQDNGGIIVRQGQGSAAPDYDIEDMAFLRESRQRILSYLETTQHTPAQILSVLLQYGQALQAQWDGGEPAHFPKEPALCERPGDPGALFSFFAELEILTEQWRQLLSAPPAVAALPRNTRALLRYFITRHYLQAISDFDLAGRICFSVIACIMIGSVDLPVPRAAQLFSKEIENNSENLYRILDGVYAESALGTAALCRHLSSGNPLAD